MSGVEGRFAQVGGLLPTWYMYKIALALLPAVTGHSPQVDKSDFGQVPFHLRQEPP